MNLPEELMARLTYASTPHVTREYRTIALGEADCKAIMALVQHAEGLYHDNPEFDGTDAAHPAWWRGHHYTSQVFARLCHEVLNGKPLIGTANEPWESLRQRLYRIARGRAELEQIADEMSNRKIGGGKAGAGKRLSPTLLAWADRIMVVVKGRK